MLYIGTAGSVEETLAEQAGISFHAVESGQIRGMAPWTAARNLLKVAQGARQCRTLLQQFQPDVVFVTGGFVAAPVVWAASRVRTPVVIYLPDVEPGVAIRRLSRYARCVAVTFPEVAAHFPGKAAVTGYPVRPEFLAWAEEERRGQARQALGLSQEVPVLLVFGGSRGARSINLALAAALPQLLPHCQVVHVSGSLDWPEVEKRAAGLPGELRARYHAYAYLHGEMAQAMAAADLAVARAGASTLGEFPLMRLPSILVPYPYSGQHQDANADYLASRGAAVKLPDADLAKRLTPAVLELLQEPARLAAMREAAGRLAKPDAAQSIARLLVDMAAA